MLLFTFICLNFCFSQRIAYRPSVIGPIKFISEGQRISGNSVLSLMDEGSKEYKLVNGGLTEKNVATFCMIGTGASVGLIALRVIGNGYISWGITGGLFASSWILTLDANNRVGRGIEMYNASYGTFNPSRNSYNIQLGASSNGLGLFLNF